MTVSELLEDCLIRLPKDILRRGGEPYILRTMNRLYKQLNHEHKCLQKSQSITEDSGSGSALPSDWILPFAIWDANDEREENLVFKNPEMFDPSEDDTFTIQKGYIYFGSGDGTTTRTFWYYSTGLTLVNSTSPGATEVNAPEWPREALHSILFHGTCIRLARNYEMFENDLIEFRRLESDLKELHYNLQTTDPARTQPHGKVQKWIDDYERPYTLER